MCCVRVQSGSCFVLWRVVLCCVALCVCCVVLYPGLDHTLISGFPGIGGTGAPKRGTCPQACFLEFLCCHVLSYLLLSFLVLFCPVLFLLSSLCFEECCFVVLFCDVLCPGPVRLLFCLVVRCIVLCCVVRVLTTHFTCTVWLDLSPWPLSWSVF